MNVTDIKRFSDVFEDELDKIAEEYKDREFAEEVVSEDLSMVRIYLPSEAVMESL